MIASPRLSPVSDSDQVEIALEVANLAWWSMDCPTGAVRFHRRMAEMLGYDPGRFSYYTDFTALLHPDDLAPAEEAMRAHLRGTAPDYRADYRIRTSAGDYVWFQDIGRISQRDEQGRPVRVTGLVLDISDRKRTEAALRDGQERFRALFLGHSAAMLVLDPGSGEIVDANAAAASFYGWSIAELTRMRIQQINALAPGDVQAALAKATTGQSARFEFRHRRADGSIRDVEVFSNRVEIGGRLRLYSIIHDISDRLRAEEALRENERRLVRAEAFARYGHWEFSLDDRIMYASDGAVKIYGFTGSGVPLSDVQRCVLAEDRPRLDAALRDLVEHGAPYDVVFRIRRASDGAIVAVHSRAEFSPSERKVFGVVQDVTERERIVAEREKLILDLQSAVEHIRTLRGIVPICSSCKKVRDDKGFWEQVDAYVTRHTEARFSHGICPDCMKRLYADW
jgi:PAS domain S-box-containing protein